ncbi:CDGSH iron-sulfur domain-containing protein [Streptomyces sp. NPDC006516]|uniref:CDGSH iron-sulfur domain-containing protein n=1 Tax=Streptomyces sp. NPDC006516 TaxID=3154309 RepID=UPI0033BA2FAB
MPNTPEQPCGTGRPCRITLGDDGPLLVEGPVEVTGADGSVAVSDRFVVAICTCRRSRMYPWCDTSHRRRTQPGRRTD